MAGRTSNTVNGMGGSDDLKGEPVWHSVSLPTSAKSEAFESYVVLAQQQTYDGGNTAGLRMRRAMGADLSLKHWNILAPSGTVIGRVEDGGGRRYYLKDHLGSVRAVLDESGSVKETRDYYPFGLPMPGRYERSSPPTKQDFTGHPRDVETQFHYAGARYYSAAFGWWTTTDPILGQKGPKKLLKQDQGLLTMNPYNYAFDNPIGLRDPTGLAPNDIIFEEKGGNTVRIETAREEVTAKIDLEVNLKKSRTIPLPNFKETGSNVAYGIQVAASKTAMMAAGTSQEAFMQAMAFGSTPGTSYFAGVETATVAGNSTEYSVGGSASFVFAWSTDNTTLEPKEFAGGYGMIGGTAEVDMGAADVGINVEVSTSVGSNAAMFEVGATGSGGPNLSFPFAAGPSGKVSVGGGGSVFLGTLPIPLGGISPAPFF